MTVKEIKAKLPEADVYALSDDFTYLIVLSIIQVSRRTAQQLDLGVRAAIILVDDPASAVKVLEIKENG